MPLGALSLLPFALLALGAPLVVGLTPRGRRTVAVGVLGVLALAHLGLYLLEVSRTLCWTLVGAASALAAGLAFPRRAAWAAGGAALAGLALGLAFEATPGHTGLYLYVGAATPLLLAVPLAALASRWLAWDASLASRGSALALVAFAGAIPFTSFWPSFLQTFEPAHAPLVLAAIVGLVLLARVAWPRVERARAVESVADLPDPPRAPPAALSLALLGAACVAAAYAAPRSPWLLAGASLVAILAAGALALGFARARALALRARRIGVFARGPLEGTIPRGALVEEGAPTVFALDALARKLAATRAPLAVLVARAEAPLWTVPDDAYAWLLAQAPGRRVHVAVVEGADVSFVPPALGESDA